MGKEVKIGLAVIGVLLCVFGGVLFFRLRREAPDTTQRKVAATKKSDGKSKSGKKESPNSETQADERRSRSSGKSTRVTSSDSEAEPADSDRNQAPALNASPYRDRSDRTRRGRYDDALTTQNGNPSNEPESEETAQEDGAGQEDGQLTELSMPDDRFAQQGARGAGARDTFSQNVFSQDAEEGQAESSDAAENDAPASTGEQESEELAMDRDADRYRRDERVIESGLDSSEAEEAESEGVQLSPLVEDESEVRPAANHRYAKTRYEQERSEQERSERDQFDRDRGQAPREQEEQEMADDTESVASEPLDRRPVQRQSDAGSYVVEPNDNFWRISQKVYGTGAYFKALEEHNRRQQGEKRLINVGEVLAVPPLATLRENYPDLCPKPRNTPTDRETLLTSSSVRGSGGSRTYTVAEGDTLFDIARHELGKASRWAEIYRLNREQLGDDFNYLSPGMQLVMPERDDQADPIASRPRREGYRR